MKKIILISILVLVLLMVACEQQSQTETQPESEIKEEKGFMTDKLKFQDEGMTGEIIKNKLTKKAEAKITFSISDDEEYSDFLGEQFSAVPMMVNMVCGLFGTAFFNPAALEELSESGNMTAEDDADLPGLLEGYTVAKVTIKFVDEENKKLIADCMALGSEWEDIKFNSYREYENSLFGMEIGKTLQEVGEEEAKKALDKEITHLDVSCLSPENWDADADDDGIVLGVAPLSRDNTIVAAEGSITTKAYVLERDEDTWEYFKGDLVNTRTDVKMEGEERFDYFDNWDGYRVAFLWDDTESYPADKRDYGIIYVTFTTKDGKTFEAKIGDDYEDCQIRPK